MRGCISRWQQARRDAALVWFERRPEPGVRQCRQSGHMRRAARGIHAWRGSTPIVTSPAVVPMVMSPPNRAQVSRYADGNAFAVPRRSTPCVDAFRGDNRHAAMRLRYGFNAGQSPICINAASPDTCAALRAASTHGVDLRRLSRRCLTAFLVPRRSTPCVDAFRGDIRHAAMRLRSGFNAGQNPARVNAASPDTCAALRAASTHGVDLRDCCVADRCADGYVAANPRPGFRDMWMETRSRCHVDPRHAWMHFAVATGTPRCGFGMV